MSHGVMGEYVDRLLRERQGRGESAAPKPEEKRRPLQIRRLAILNDEVMIETDDESWMAELTAWRAQLAQIRQTFRNPENFRPTRASPLPQGHVMFGTSRKPAGRIEAEPRRLWENGFAVIHVGKRLSWGYGEEFRTGRAESYSPDSGVFFVQCQSPEGGYCTVAVPQEKILEKKSSGPLTIMPIMV